MTGSYDDITSRIPEAPTWHDSDGVPRYGEFSPEMCPDIYTSEVALVEIQCQSCGQLFPVEIHDSSSHRLLHDPGAPSLGTLLKQNAAGYGDAPRHGGCAGETMTTDIVRVIG